ncbi:MAG TPA: hypothetical protein VHV82_14275 [Sporichthyaceae bacterium]|nr:hypothetical protein [Sporichthyaceae bacterium]
MSKPTGPVDGGVDWAVARAALQSETARLTTMLRTVRRPTAPALGAWNLSEVAVHVATAWAVIPALAAGDLDAVRAALPGLLPPGAIAMIQTPQELAHFTVAAVKACWDPDLAAVADRIDRAAAAYLNACADRHPEQAHQWMIHGVRFTQPTFTCHLLNETITHSYDIARAERRPWRVDPDHARHVVEGFVLPVLARRAADDSPGVGHLQLRIRGGRNYLVEFTAAGGARIAAGHSTGKADAYLSADPAALLLARWRRVPTWRSLPTGGLLAWGRKPWLATRLATLAPAI